MRATSRVRDGITEAAFVAMRTAGDCMLTAPGLILPLLQSNICACALPPPEPDENVCVRLPVYQLGAAQEAGRLPFRLISLAARGIP